MMHDQTMYNGLLNLGAVLTDLGLGGTDMYLYYRSISTMGRLSDETAACNYHSNQTLVAEADVASQFVF